jgi:hypothetical protein
MPCFSGYTARSTEITPAARPHAARDAAPSPPRKPESQAFSRFLSAPYITEPATSDRPSRPPPVISEEDRRAVSAVYVLRPKADQDLEDQAYYLATRSGPELGHRFLLAAHETFVLLDRCWARIQCSYTGSSFASCYAWRFCTWSFSLFVLSLVPLSRISRAIQTATHCATSKLLTSNH